MLGLNVLNDYDRFLTIEGIFASSDEAILDN